MQMCLSSSALLVASCAGRELIERLAALPKTGRSAICWVAVISMLTSLVHWGLSSILGSLLVRALARREELHMDYRAAGAAAYLGLGAVWAMGLSSSAAQLQANPASMPPALLAITGVLPFDETIFLWQSIALTAVLIAVSAWIAWLTAPRGPQVRTAGDLGVSIEPARVAAPGRTRPGEWLEYSPLLNVLIAASARAGSARFASKGGSPRSRTSTPTTSSS